MSIEHYVPVTEQESPGSVQMKRLKEIKEIYFDSPIDVREELDQEIEVICSNLSQLGIGLDDCKDMF